MSNWIWQKHDWPHLRWRVEGLTELLAKARLCQGRLLGQTGWLGFQLTQEARAEILVEDTFNTAAIEGETLDKYTIRSSVARRLGLPTAGLPTPDRHTEGLVTVLLDATENYEKPLTKKRLQGWHGALFPTGFSGLHRIPTGVWRKKDPMRVVSGPIGREKVHYEAPPSKRINKEISQFLTWWKNPPPHLDGIIRAAIAHFWFVTIHPFEDGNGRISRAVADMALAQDEASPIRLYSMSAQIMEQRNEYYNVLEQAQRGDLDVTKWLKWFLECFINAMERSGKMISDTVAKGRFWQAHAQTQLNDRQRKVVNRLLDSGREGFKEGLNTRKYVSLAKVSRATAYREITDLVEKGILKKKSGKGRSTKYEIAWLD